MSDSKAGRRLWVALGIVSGGCLGFSGLRVSGVLSPPATAGLFTACCESTIALPAGARALLPSLWIGLAAMALGCGLLRTARRVLRTQRFISRLQARRLAIPRDVALVLKETGLTGAVGLVDVEERHAFCHGLLRPRICLTRGLVYSLTRPELRAVLIHERHHLANRHPVQLLLTGLVAEVLFFLPLADDLRDYHEARCELGADLEAIQGTGRRPLASALMKMVQGAECQFAAQGLTVSGLNVTQARVGQLLEGNEIGPSFSLDRVALSLASLAAMCVLWMGAAS